MTRSKFPLDEEALRRLAAILEDTGLTEIEVEAGDHRMRVAKSPAPVQMAPAVATLPAAVPGGGPSMIASPCAVAESGHTVASPMVGTAYLASEPGAKPFVQVGDSVAEGQTLLIIEAMKVMNTLPAPRAGRITQIHVQDGQPVEFGEPLLVLE